MTRPAPLLEVADLAVSFPSPAGRVRAVTGASFQIAAGQRLGLVGESGSGKTVTALTIMGLTAAPGVEIGGRIEFGGTDLTGLGARRWRSVRGTRIGMIFQNPLNCLNPAMTVGDQVAEPLVVHRGASRREARRRAVELLADVGIPSPSSSADEYPHRFSGGMRQRVMIAIALSCEPELLIADEPTTALDVTVQAQIVDLLSSVCEERGTAVLFITHDLGVLARFAERIAVMYAGKVVEQGAVDTIYYGATHPYTWGLMTSITRLDERRRTRLRTIPGAPPSALALPPGCPFHPRCPHARDRCVSEVPAPVVHPRDDHPSACHFAGELVPPEPLREARA